MITAKVVLRIAALDIRAKTLFCIEDNLISHDYIAAIWQNETMQCVGYVLLSVCLLIGLLIDIFV